MSRIRSIVILLVCLALSFAAGGVGARFMPDAWYFQLVKPAWTPPGYLFGIVWPVLYTLMGVAAWLAVVAGGGFAQARGPLALFAAQLALNAAWTWLFFGLHQPGLALAELLVLWAVILATLIAFWRRRRVWVTFAAALNAAIWRMNG